MNNNVYSPNFEILQLLKPVTAISVCACISRIKHLDKQRSQYSTRMAIIFHCKGCWQICCTSAMQTMCFIMLLKLMFGLHRWLCWSTGDSHCQCSIQTELWLAGTCRLQQRAGRSSKWPVFPKVSGLALRCFSNESQPIYVSSCSAWITQRVR